MLDALQGCRLKQQRADQHIQMLQRDVPGFFKQVNSYRMLTKQDPESGEDFLWLEPKERVPVKKWGIVLGDILHNLRSALDHLVWGLTLENGHTPPANPIPLASDWTKTQFPIYEFDPARGKGWDTKPPKQLWGVRPRYASAIEQLQPFFGGKDIPSNPLWLLAQLSNIDKHRTIHLIGFYAHAVRVESTLEDGDIYRVKGPRPGEHGAEIGRFPAGESDMDMDFEVEVDVVLGEGEPAQFRTLTDVLGQLYGYVNDIINWFDYAVRGAPGPVPRLLGPVGPISLLPPPEEGHLAHPPQEG